VASLSLNPWEDPLSPLYFPPFPAFSGVFRIWQKGGHGERVEREPITGVWGRSPQRGPGVEPLVGGQGGEAPLKLKHFLFN